MSSSWCALVRTYKELHLSQQRATWLPAGQNRFPPAVFCVGVGAFQVIIHSRAVCIETTCVSKKGVVLEIDQGLWPSVSIVAIATSSIHTLHWTKRLMYVPVVFRCTCSFVGQQY